MRQILAKMPFMTLFHKHPILFWARAASCLGLLILFGSFFMLYMSYSDHKAATDFTELKNYKPLPVKSAIVKKDEEPVNVEQLIGWELFGKAGQEIPTEETNPLDLPITSLKLTLKGVITSDQKGQGSALIAGADGKDRYYEIGGTIPGPAILREVYPNRILLEYRARLETLWLHDPETLRNKFNDRRTFLMDYRKNQELTLLLNNYKKLAQKEPLKLFEAIQFSAQKNKNRLVGITINPGKNSQDFKKLGLNAGDVIYAINDVPVQNMNQNGRSIFSELKSSENLKVSLRRDVGNIDLLYSLQ